MNKIMKEVIPIVMSFAMAVCLVPTWAGAKEMHAQEDGISLQSFEIGKQYFIRDKKMEIMAMFNSQDTLVVKCRSLTKISRYVEMYVSTSSKSFKVRTFTVKGNDSHSELYSINRANAGKITITIYPHTSSSPSSGYIDPLTGILQ